MPTIETTITALSVAGVAAYVLAGIVLALRRERTGYALFAAGWAANAALFVLNWVLGREPPFGNMHHVLVFMAFCVPVLFALLARRASLSWTGAYFAFAAALPLLGTLFMSRHLQWRRMPALQSPWFVPHVLAYMLSYALATVAFLLLVVRRTGLTRKVRLHSRAAYAILRMGYPLMTFGMLSGALWAEEAWGAYWSWDAKETWSLITWTLYAVYFHCRRSPRFGRWTDLAHGVAFAALVVTFLLVNLLPKLGSVLHSYA
jgi:ABC-type transport system involved in cytochrome c biogenesis permease subunit